MRDVTSAEFDLPLADYRRIEPMLLAAGFRMSRMRYGYLADGLYSDFAFYIGEGRRLRRIGFALNAPAERRVERIGRSLLTIGPGPTASWSFGH